MNPDEPSAPTTTIDGYNVVINWAAPSDNGSPITGFKVLIRQNNLVYTEELVNCDGSETSIITASKCSVPISVLIVTPYSLPWGANVFAKVIAYNIYGDSLTSEPGNEAIILTIPDSPVSLTETVSDRTDNTITFAWSEGATDGGAPVLDYTISFDQASNTYIELDSGVTAESYTAIGLTQGLTYKFKVEARNTYGFSTLSSEVSILCATVPSVPATPMTTNVLE
jgi:hypothetical protein